MKRRNLYKKRRGGEDKRLLLALFFLLLLDFASQWWIFGVGRGAPYLLKDYTTPPPEERVSFKRVLYNFKNFSVFWLRSPHPISTLEEFLTCDGNPLWMNLVGHFLAFALAVLFFRFVLGAKDPVRIFLYLEILNVLHEYAVEGSFVDPSFCDLWLDTIGILFGFFFAFLVEKGRLT